MGRTACTEPQCLHKGALYLYFILLESMKKFYFRVLGYGLGCLKDVCRFPSIPVTETYNSFRK